MAPSLFPPVRHGFARFLPVPSHSCDLRAGPRPHGPAGEREIGGETVLFGLEPRERMGDTEGGRLAAVVGVGNELRRDDGVGVWVTRRLRELAAPLDVLQLEAGMCQWAESWTPERQVYVVVPVRGLTPAGTLWVVDAHREPIPDLLLRASGRVSELARAIESARAQRSLPHVLSLMAIGGLDFGWGVGLTPAVRSTAQLVVDRILALGGTL